MSIDDRKSESEIDQLRYAGNSVPRSLRLIWTILIVFCVVYLARYMWPDFLEWLNKM
jgi:hypothetical protein